MTSEGKSECKLHGWWHTPSEGCRYCDPDVGTILAAAGPQLPKRGEVYIWDSIPHRVRGANEEYGVLAPDGSTMRLPKPVYTWFKHVNNQFAFSAVAPPAIALVRFGPAESYYALGMMDKVYELDTTHPVDDRSNIYGKIDAKISGSCVELEAVISTGDTLVTSCTVYQSEAMQLPAAPEFGAIRFSPMTQPYSSGRITMYKIRDGGAVYVEA